MAQRQDHARPTYKAALEAIGRYFDQQVCRGIFVAEIEEGYIGKAYPVEQETELFAEGFTFPYDDVQALIEAPAMDGTEPLTTPHCPYGYGLFMQAVGEMCDRTNAAYVSILEITNGFVLAFTTPGENGRRPERRRFVLDRLGVEELVSRCQ